jgi:hypothetical protein
MLLLATAAQADTYFDCETVSIPADAWQYHDVSVHDPYRDALAELEVWRDTTCTSTSCTFSSYDTYACEETSCVTSGGAVWYEYVEEFYSGVTTTLLQVTPPESAGLDWTWGSLDLRDYEGWNEGSFDASVEWSGELQAGWPTDSSFRSSSSWTDTGYVDFTDGSWDGPTCSWNEYTLVNEIDGYTWALAFDVASILVYEEYSDCFHNYRIHATVNGVEYGAVDRSDWSYNANDVDRDGYCGSVDDCDDTDPAIYPCATETAFDGIDSNCMGELDRDGDGEMSYAEGGTDCFDSDASINSAAAEIPYDGIDNDCDGRDLDDVDGDGERSTATTGRDCDDTDPTVYPGADEVPYDGIDQDCSGSDLNDLDEDGYIAVAAGGDDCEDEMRRINPGMTDNPYDGIDQDCSGSDLTDRDGDGVDAEEVGGMDCDDVDDTVYSGAPEVPYDGVDQDCDGADLLDADADGVDGLGGGGADCDDEDASIYPGAAEVECDGADQDCDGVDACPPDTTSEEDTTCATSGGGGGALVALLGLAALVGRARTSVRPRPKLPL